MALAQNYWRPLRNFSRNEQMDLRLLAINVFIDYKDDLLWLVHYYGPTKFSKQESLDSVDQCLLVNAVQRLLLLFFLRRQHGSHAWFLLSLHFCLSF